MREWLDIRTPLNFWGKARVAALVISLRVGGIVLERLIPSQVLITLLYEEKALIYDYVWTVRASFYLPL